MPTARQVKPRALAAIAHRPSRPLAITGRTGVGKTALLRATVAGSGLDAVWCSAFDLVERMVDALRGDRYDALQTSLATDPRPLVIEHLEDLKEKPQTREELRLLLLLRATRGGATFLTLTSGRSDSAIVRWLDRWADVERLV